MLFTAYQLLSHGRVPSHNPIGFAGKFKETQWRAWVETIINLVVSFACVFHFGIYGVLAGTIAALLYRANDIVIFANKVVLNRSPWPTYRRWLINLCIFVGVVFVFVQLPLKIDSYLWLILNAIWVAVIVMMVFFGINSIMEPGARIVAAKYIRKLFSTVTHK